MRANRRILRHLTARVSLVATLLLAGCGDPPADAPDAGSALDATADAAVHRWEPIGTSTYVDGARTWTVTRARVLRPDGGRTYVQWIPSDKPAPRPVVVMTMPYAGIDWTGEALDARWAALPAGQHPDVDEPSFDGSSVVVYDLYPVDRANEEAKIHLLNDYNVLLVYGRFYAGGSVGDDVADMRAGMWFLAEQPDLDRARIGTYGASWGGFEALYAAANADPRAPASVTVAVFPPSDFSTWAMHAATRTAPVRAFLTPYLNRIYATTGGAPGAAGADYAGLRASELCATLPDATLLLHDDLDNLVPVAQSRDLRAACGADAVYWPRPGMLDPGLNSHGALVFEPVLPSYVTYALAYLHLRLATPGQSVVGMVSRPALDVHLGLVHDAQQAARDVTWAAPRLRELTDPRLYLYDISVSPPVLRTGAETVAAAVNAEWGTSYTAATIGAALAQGLPAP